jgi:SAM-dependent methyltransferase
VRGAAAAGTGGGDAVCPICDHALGPPVIEGHDRLLRVPGTFLVRECERCRLGVTEPRLGGERLSRHYAGAYAPFEVPRGPLARLLLRLQRWRADLLLRREPYRSVVMRGPGRVLDVGCGRGDLAAAFLRARWRADGIDPSERAVAIARHAGVDARLGSLAELEIPERHYDLVLFSHSLEHIPDPVGELRRVHDALVPGGVVLIAVPNWSSWQRKAFGSRWFHLDVPRHLQHFSDEALRRAAGKAGLEAVEVRESTSHVGLPGSLQYALFGHCVARGRGLAMAHALSVALYPATGLLGKLLGGDCLYFSAARPVETAPRDG